MHGEAYGSATLTREIVRSGVLLVAKAEALREPHDRRVRARFTGQRMGLVGDALLVVPEQHAATVSAGQQRRARAVSGLLRRGALRLSAAVLD